MGDAAKRISAQRFVTCGGIGVGMVIEPLAMRRSIIPVSGETLPVIGLGTYIAFDGVLSTSNAM